MFELLIIALYDVILLIFTPLYILRYLFRGRINRAIFQRIFINRKLFLSLSSLRFVFWVHGVSVGEVSALKGFIESLRKVWPERDIIISTVTPQGRLLAEDLYKDLRVIYLPLDLSFVVKKFISLIKPKIFISMETEIWPNLYYFLKKRGCIIIIINGRISNRSFKFYRLIKPFLKRVFTCVDFAGLQSNLAKERFSALGLKKEKMKVTGNIKFQSIEVKSSLLEEFKRRWHPRLKDKNLIIVAGSTHSPEENILLKVYRSLLGNFSSLGLILCPRHIERVNSIAKIVRRMGFLPVRVTSFEDKQNSVIILDTLGQLIYFYSLADIVFVGGSLVKFGGHNILEPAYFSKPIIFGPYMFNFQEIKEIFLEKRAAWQVRDTKELEKALRRLIEDSSLRKTLSQRAQAVIKEGPSAIEEDIEIVRSFLNGLS